MKTTDRIVLVFGSTGTAGTGAVKAALEDPHVAEVRAVTRRALDVRHEKLREVRCDDFLRLEAIAECFEDVDVCLDCLGISAMKVPDEAEYRVIHVDYPVAACRALAGASPGARFVYLSGMGAKAGARAMWARVKAEAENALAEEALDVISVRPGYIHPVDPRGVSRWLLGPLLAILPPLGIEAGALGRAMLALARDPEPLSEPVPNAVLRQRSRVRSAAP